MPTKNSYFNLRSLNRLTLFLIAAGVILAFNLYGAIKETAKLAKIRKRIPYTFTGDRFLGLDHFIGKAPAIGYYTDKNIEKDSRAAMQFAQAQFTLAPTLLDLNNLEHEFVVFDCSSPQTAMKKLQESGLSPLKANPHGIILAQRKNSSTEIKAQKAFQKKLGIYQRP